MLIDSLCQHSSAPLAITPIVISQLQAQALYQRDRDPKQSPVFSFARFLVPHLMGYRGWAILMHSDMLCRDDIAERFAARKDASGLWN